MPYSCYLLSHAIQLLFIVACHTVAICCCMPYSCYLLSQNHTIAIYCRMLYSCYLLPLAMLIACCMYSYMCSLLIVSVLTAHCIYSLLIVCAHCSLYVLVARCMCSLLIVCAHCSLYVLTACTHWYFVLCSVFATHNNYCLLTTCLSCISLMSEEFATAVAFARCDISAQCHYNPPIPALNLCTSAMLQ